MPIELEMKLRIPDDSTGEKLFSDAEVEQYINGTISNKQMSACYYDTPGGELSSRRWSLRLRDEGGVKVAAVKTSSVGVTGYLFTRNEWQVYAQTIEQAIPLLIAEGAPDELASVTDGKPLVERCCINFERKSAILKLPDGLVVEMCVDKGHITADGKSEPLHELEIELLFGRAEDLAPLCDVLTSRYPLESEPLSKYERALRLIRSRPR